MMRRSLKTITVAVLILFAVATTAHADFRLKFKTTENAREGESILYFKGRRQRNDLKLIRADGTPAAMTFIYQCDLKRQIALDDTKRIFYEHPIVPIQEFLARGDALYAQQAGRKQREVKMAGHVLETFTVTDTGERREMFGYTARRIKTTLTWEATPQGCSQTPLRRESDGWYVDLLYGTFCSYDISGFDEGELTALEQSKCGDYYRGHYGDGKRFYGIERKQVGTARFGFPLMLTVKSYSDDGRPQVRTTEAVEVSHADLDASLFEIPATYTKFKPPKRSLASRALSLFGKE